MEEDYRRCMYMQTVLSFALSTRRALKESLSVYEQMYIWVLIWNASSGIIVHFRIVIQVFRKGCQPSHEVLWSRQ